jgi:hypothetical protein
MEAAVSIMDISNTRDTSPMSVIHCTNMETLNYLSPISSTASLDKFLSTPASEDPVSAQALESAIFNTLQEELSLEAIISASPTSQRAVNIARSVSSVGSVHSFQSWSSVMSSDSRGPRRGRRSWTRLISGRATESPHRNDIQRHYTGGKGRPQGLCNLTSASMVSLPRDNEDSSGSRRAILEPSRRQFFCTWPSCTSSFQYRYDWSRHEEALHYCPFHWICCRENSQIGDSLPCHICMATNHTATQHCGHCLVKDIRSRTFLREDQLAQHIKRAHSYSDAVNPKLLKEFLSAWRIDNPSFSKAFLHCGFCGFVADTWTQRQDHVHDHLKKGACKSSWWPKRQPWGCFIGTT